MTRNPSSGGAYVRTRTGGLARDAAPPPPAPPRTDPAPAPSRPAPQHSNRRIKRK